MKEFERIENRFKQLKDFLLERQAEDPDADKHDEGDGYNIARVDLHEIKLAFFALAQERDRLRAERDDARQMFCNAMTDHCEEDEARQIAKEQGWDCFKEATE